MRANELSLRSCMLCFVFKGTGRKGAEYTCTLNQKKTSDYGVPPETLICNPAGHELGRKLKMATGTQTRSSPHQIWKIIYSNGCKMFIRMLMHEKLVFILQLFSAFKKLAHIQHEKYLTLRRLLTSFLVSCSDFTFKCPL